MFVFLSLFPVGSSRPVFRNASTGGIHGVCMQLYLFFHYWAVVLYSRVRMRGVWHALAGSGLTLGGR
jgi:hypothetical protein